MRFGRPLLSTPENAREWVKVLSDLGCRAAYCPVDEKSDDRIVRSYAQAAAKEDIVIAEVGVWDSPLTDDSNKASAALSKCIARLDLAERIGAVCCVNVAGSRGANWMGPDPRNLTDETFDLIVEMVRKVVDAVRPTRTFFTLEAMPWMYPDSAECYLRLLRAIDRRAFAVHYDPVNLVVSPAHYFRSGDYIREFVSRLGPYIRSVHAKDVILKDDLTVRLSECAPGTGGLDYPVLLRELSGLNPNLPVMLEHLSTEAAYRRAMTFVHRTAASLSVSV